MHMNIESTRLCINFYNFVMEIDLTAFETKKFVYEDLYIVANVLLKNIPINFTIWSKYRNHVKSRL